MWKNTELTLGKIYIQYNLRNFMKQVVTKSMLNQKNKKLVPTPVTVA
jgi:hypothetical protein